MSNGHKQIKKGWYIYLLRKELDSNLDIKLKLRIVSGWYIYLLCNELDSTLEPKRKELITLGSYIYFIGELAILLVVLYAIFKSSR